MKVHFKGTRGSIPISYTAAQIKKKVVGALLAARGKDLRSESQILEFVEKKLPFHLGSGWGGNTACVFVETDSQEKIIFDAGSGIRPLGQEFAKAGLRNTTFHIFISHLHYDHIQGIPFFIPAYDPSNKIIFHGAHEELEIGIKNQMRPPYFPIDMDSFNAEVTFEIHQADEKVEVCNSVISLFKQDHPGVSYGYRMDHGSKSVVYSTDAEHKNAAHSKEYPYVEFIRGADLLIFDALYTHSQSIGNREHWGHSSNVMGVELAARGEVKTLAIFHHDPGSSDQDIVDFEGHTRKFLQSSRSAIRETQPGIPGAPSARKFPVEILHAYDGLTLTP